LKKEKNDLLTNQLALKKIIDKKRLSYIAENLEKRVLHIPVFANTP